MTDERKRGIEFRGKKRTNNENDGKWVYGHYLYMLAEDCGCHCQIYLDEKDQSFEDGFHTVYPETVGQYTGMMDENGVKIFEGDIIEFNNYGQGYKRGVVEFSVGVGAWWIFDKLLSELLHEQDQWMLENFSCKGVAKIIGNIHDNPELFSRSKK
jgi:uncharacterized phage protein (TIGR01671 family)